MNSADVDFLMLKKRVNEGDVDFLMVNKSRKLNFLNYLLIITREIKIFESIIFQ